MGSFSPAGSSGRIRQKWFALLPKPPFNAAMRLPSETNRIRVLTRPFAIRKYFANNPARRLHLGSGPNIVSGWLNADKFNSHADIYLDVYQRLPFADSCFEAIYAEHLFEHVKIEKVQHLLSEALRILRPNGVFRISVPDLELFARKYVERDHEFFVPYLEKFEARRAAGNPKYWIVRTSGAVFMSLANRRFFHHRWMYDFETIEACACAVGFSRAIKQEFRQSVREDTGSMDKEERQHESVYIDLVK